MVTIFETIAVGTQLPAASPQIPYVKNYLIRLLPNGAHFKILSHDSGVVNYSDISEFIAILIAGSYQAEADCNQDGVVNSIDIPVFVGVLAN